MPIYTLQQETSPGNIEEVQIEADSEEEAKQKAREEHGGVTVGEVTSDEEGIQAADVPEDAQEAGDDDADDESS